MQVESDINLKKFFNSIIFNIYNILFIFATLIILFIGLYSQSEKIFRISSLIEITDDQNAASLDIVDSITSSDGILLDEKITLYLSNTNLNKLINKTKLDLNILINNDLVENINKDLYFGEYQINFKSTISDDILLKVEKVSDNSFNIYDESSNLIFKEKLAGERIDFDFGFITLKNINLVDINSYFEIYITNRFKIKDYLIQNLSINKSISSRYSWEQGSLLDISLDTNDIELGKKIINTANSIFIEQDKFFNALEADASLEFINSQIEKVGNDLSKSEKSLNDFQLIYGTVNVDLEIAGLIDEISALNEKISLIKIKRVELEAIYNKSSQQILSLKKQQSELQNQLELLNKKVKDLPGTQQEYINLFSQVQINKNFYEQLMSKKLEVSILRASTIGNVRIIDDAYVVTKVAPSLTNFLLFAMALASLLSLALVIIRSYLFAKIQYPAQLSEEFQDIKTIGVVENIDNMEAIKIDNFELLDSINSLTTNLLLLTKEMHNSAKIIEITGYNASIGKSTIARHTALSLSLLGKKVALIDFDYRRGDQHKFLKTKQSDDFSIFDINNIHNTKINENLYFIPRVKKASSKILTFINSPSFNQFLENAKKEFDYIIFDTPPAGSVPEALALSIHADLIIGIVRHRVSKLREISMMHKIFSDVGKPMSCFVYNDYQKPMGYYNYVDSYSYNYYSTEYGYDND